MKNTYSDPQIQFVTVSIADIITTSGDNDPAEDDVAWALNIE